LEEILMKRNRFYISLLAALLVLLTASVVFAAVYLNTASGGNFDADLEGWASAGGSGTILHDITFVRTGAGSASIDAPDDGIAETYNSPCFTLTGDGTHLIANGYMFIPAGQAASFNNARVRIRVFPNLGCTGAATVYNGATINNTVTNAWVQLPTAFGSKGTLQSVQLQVALLKVNGQPAPVVYIDDMYLSDATSTAVNLQSVSTQTINNSLFVFTAVGLVVVGSGVVFMRRRRVVGNR
jgi:hypothetical protein